MISHKEKAVHFAYVENIPILQNHLLKSRKPPKAKITKFHILVSLNWSFENILCASPSKPQKIFVGLCSTYHVINKRTSLIARVSNTSCASNKYQHLAYIPITHYSQYKYHFWDHPILSAYSLHTFSTSPTLPHAFKYYKYVTTFGTISSNFIWWIHLKTSQRGPCSKYPAINEFHDT